MCIGHGLMGYPLKEQKWTFGGVSTTSINRRVQKPQNEFGRDLRARIDALASQGGEMHTSVQFERRRVSALQRTSSLCTGVLWMLMAMISCAVPGHPYRVSPPVMGTLAQITAEPSEIELVFYVMHRENPTIYEIQKTRLAEDGRFYFEPVALKIAGQEYSKFYRVFLHYRDGGRNQVIWRAEFSRKDLAGRVQLDCVLDRRARVSQPCLVREPLRHPWLVQEGERSFQRLCTSCHGDSGTGGTIANDMAPDLSRIAARRDGRFDRMEIAEVIEGSESPADHGPRTMPVWGERLSSEYWRYSNPDQLAGATLDPILVYLESMQRDNEGG